MILLILASMLFISFLGMIYGTILFMDGVSQLLWGVCLPGSTLILLSVMVTLFGLFVIFDMDKKDVRRKKERIENGS